MHLSPTHVVSPTHVASLPLVFEIDFDVVPSGTVVNQHYPGVTFEAIPTKDGYPGPDVFASDAYNQMQADTPRNVVTLTQPPKAAALNELGGAIRATFTAPQLYVSIDAYPIPDLTEFEQPEPGAVPYLSVLGLPLYLPHDRVIYPLLATMYFPALATDQNFQQWRRLEYASMSQTPNIGGIVFSCAFPGVGAPVFALFDRFRFSSHLPLPSTHYLG